MRASRTTQVLARRRDATGTALISILLATLLVPLCPLGAGRAVAAPAGDAGHALTARVAAAQVVVLAQDDGMQLIGPLSALRGQAAPDLDDLRQARAARLAPLPEGRVFFRGARVAGPPASARASLRSQHLDVSPAGLRRPLHRDGQ